jgi:uncharacterized protein YggE
MECCSEEFKNSHKNFFFPVLSVLTLLLLVLVGYFFVGTLNKIKEGKNIPTTDTISITATGEVYVKPDLALASFSVVTESESVETAMKENTENMNAITDFIKKKGVEDKDLKTTNFNISPRYEWHDASVYPYYPTGKRVLVGYEITQTLQVKIRDLSKVGEIIQGATESGANQVGELQFTVDDYDTARAEAREEAIAKAKAKANELASQLGIKLVKIKSFSDTSDTPRYYGFAEKSSSAIGLGGGDSTPQIQTGENKVEVTVYITYEID